MNKIKVSVVSYLNSQPFIYGLQQTDFLQKIDLQSDIPSVCAQKLISDKVDIGLIPVAVIPKINPHFIISDYCIGANGKVASVMLYSEVPLREIKTVLLDYQSQTSVKLVRVLAKNYWKINPQWIDAKKDYENSVSGETAVVIIGDRTFGLDGKYKFQYDLADEWKKFTQLPFVFACWVANKKVSDTFINEFNAALKFGLDNREVVIQQLKNKYTTDVNFYLRENIQYSLDEEKKAAMKLFLNYCAELSS